VICGGDGTLNRFVNETDGLEIACEISYLALGTGNDFLHDIEKENDGTPVPVKQYLTDLPFVEVKGKKYRFLNNVGFGIDGYCCEEGDRLKAKSDKPVNYTAIAIKGVLFHHKPSIATVTVDGQSYSYKKVWLAATMKGRYYGGGMKSAPEQDRMAEDGSVSLVGWHSTGKLRTLMRFPSIFKGEHVKYTDMITIHKGHDVTVSFNIPTAVQIDGETVVGVTSYRVVAEKKAPVPATV
jgi:diacylglycerol kinase family enzyme